MSGDRLGALRAAKLRAIAGAHLGLTIDVDQGEGLADGAALASADRVAVLIGRPSRRSLGPALSWAAKRFDGADNAQALARVDLVLDPTVPVDEHPVDHDPGLAGSSPAADDRFGLEGGDARTVGAQLARIGGLFRPDVRVWVVEGTDVVEVTAAPAPDVPAAPGVEADELVELLRDVGLEPCAEPGMILGEVAGLEVARITVTDGVPSLAIGVGRFDQELSAVAQSDLSRRDALERAADLVRLARTMGNTAHANATHPMARLARERWLRTSLIADPGVIGAAELAALPGLWVRRGLRASAPAAAVGNDVDGRALIVVCSTGVDTDLVPAALELAAQTDASARLVLALPPNDIVPSTRRVAALALTEPEIVAVVPPWEPVAGHR